MTVELPRSFEPDRVAGEGERSDSDTPVAGATWYRAGTTGDALVYHLPDGALADAAFLTFDALVDGEHSVSFQFRLHDDGAERTFRLHYSLLPECEARIRMPLGATEQDRWKYDQSALGRFDGEAFNIGFLDVCNRPYEPLADAARRSHGRLYDLATGVADPYDDEPEYLTEF